MVSFRSYCLAYPIRGIASNSLGSHEWHSNWVLSHVDVFFFLISYDHLVTMIWWPLSSGTPEQWTWAVFHSVTEKQTFQEHLFSTVIISTYWSSVSRRPKQWMCAGFLAHSFHCVSNDASTLITTQICMQHWKYEPHSHYAKWTYRSNIFASIYQNTTYCTSYFIYYWYICVINKLAPQMPHMPNLQAHMRQLHQYIHLIWYPMQSIMWSKALIYIHFTLLTYATEQICLSCLICITALIM